MAPAFTVFSLFMMRIGILGMRRRIADYDANLGFQPYHIVMTISGFLIALGVLVFIINVAWSVKHGVVATGNVWNSRSPEWQVPSPMPLHNYEKPIQVVGDPYDYGLPGSHYVVFQGEQEHA
jgi:cytochrome c oxidase subunit 1